MSKTTHSTVQRRRWRQKGLLTALGLVFAVSATLRIGSLEFAFADATGDERTDVFAQIEPSAAPAGSGLIDPVRAALSEVEALRASLLAREAALADRERAVAAAQALVEDRLAELSEAEARLEDLVAVSDSAAENDIARLTRVYETMDPEQAAALFGQMQPSFAAGFLARMNPVASAALMAELDPEQAYAVSVFLATRNASAPTLDTAPLAAEPDTDS